MRLHVARRKRKLRRTETKKKTWSKTKLYKLQCRNKSEISSGNGGNKELAR